MTYEVNDEGKLINQETNEEYDPDPCPVSETLPQWLWDQHNYTPPQEVEP